MFLVDFKEDYPSPSLNYLLSLVSTIHLNEPRNEHKQSVLSKVNKDRLLFACVDVGRQEIKLTEAYRGHDVRQTILPEVKRGVYLRRGGFWFGLIFGISYALTVWGPHAYFLLRHSAVVVWAEILLGLVLCGLFWAFTRFFSGFFRPVFWAMLWGALAGFATPWIVWYSKGIGANLAGINLDIVIGEAISTRLFFIGFWGLGIGAFAGLLERMLLPKAWDVSSSSEGFTTRSFAVLLFCLPLTILFGIVTNDYLHSGMEEGLQAAYNKILEIQSGESDPPLITWRHGKKIVEIESGWEWPDGEFQLHLADYETETMEEFFFDIDFEDGPTVRCKAYGSTIQVCGDLTDTLEQTMARIIQSGLSQDLESLWCEICDPYIRPSTILSLKELSPNFDAAYVFTTVSQRGSNIEMNAQFNSGFELTCLFKDEEPIVVESCSGQTP